ncbi:hypothetical protein HPB52_000442 [Rhipicephalus sanguineus]|uniref:Uncharacterized protein n=1 Tax=Rhipicephalus sanguineus TaxID=34632 RepID=A0A9D4PE90_RHISA|nr:hypothetical protein HPB52_000442 [Rhipicephalus sanguineus]
MCLCLLVLMGLVVVLVITATDVFRVDSGVASAEDLDDNSGPSSSSPATKEVQTTVSMKRRMGGSPRVTVQQTSTAAPIMTLIICTVSETATSEDLYPPEEYCDYLFYTNVIVSNGSIQAEKDPVSWDLFQRKGPMFTVLQLGISFDFENVTPNDLDDAWNDLDALRKEGMKHYGLLNVLSVQSSFIATVSSTNAMIEKLKQIQSMDETAKTALAIGSYDLNIVDRANIKEGFRYAAK